MKIPAPGRMIAGFHIQVAGQGSPVVVLEAGIAASSISWSLVQKILAESTTVLSYDRLGYGWSDPPKSPRTAETAAVELAQMLAASGLSGPFILVGHSLGGLIARVYQERYPETVAGMVLVDPVVRAEWRDPPAQKRQMLARGAMLSRRGALLARMGVVGFALRMLTGGSKWIPKLLAKASAGNASDVTNRLVGEVRKMPREHWPAIAQHWSQPQAFETMADYLENLPLSVGQVDENRPFGDLPVIVLSASRQMAEHEGDASLSSRGRAIVVPNAGHWIQLDAPDAVIMAVNEVIAEVRGR